MISRIPATSLALLASLSAPAGVESAQRATTGTPSFEALFYMRNNDDDAGAKWVWLLGSADPAIWALLAERRTGQGRRGTRLPTVAGGGYPREPERARDRSIHPPYPLNGKSSR